MMSEKSTVSRALSSSGFDEDIIRFFESSASMQVKYILGIMSSRAIIASLDNLNKNVIIYFSR
jgi:hypothetical protein